MLCLRCLVEHVASNRVGLVYMSNKLENNQMKSSSIRLSGHIEIYHKRSALNALNRHPLAVGEPKQPLRLGEWTLTSCGFSMFGSDIPYRA